ITLLTATILAQVLDQYEGINPQIKWPNDILINNKKVSGILTEMQAEQDKVSYVIIGIGINVNKKLSSYPKDLQSKVTSLNIDKNIINSFEDKFDLYLKDGFPNVKSIWEQYGFRINEQLEIKTSNESWSGKFLGIAEDGALLAKRDSGIIEKIYSAEISWF